ncbi:hypothetical protein PanWU01x14_350390 [Parasponia andersonii]|uniref:Uncharacterized protein n=1 Tax=Parasponia andersonii TaxID=3476 RepID=A0A2P5AAY5_PARAD|nr:hypothetical protein PanWU01x14_350390 [Parasponia andersonii]
MWAERDWNVEKGLELEPSDGGFALTVDLILSTADSENLNTLSLSCGSGLASPFDGATLGSKSPLDEACGSAGGERSSFTRVFRALVRSRKGGIEMVSDPLQISAHELMKCHVDVPSRITWLKAHPIAIPSFNLVNCGRQQHKS